MKKKFLENYKISNRLKKNQNTNKRNKKPKYMKKYIMFMDWKTLLLQRCPFFPK